MLKSIKKSTIMGIFDIAIFEILRVFQGHFFQKDCFGRGAKPERWPPWLANGENF